MDIVQGSPSPPTARAVALKCLAAGVLLGTLFYAIHQSTFGDWMVNPIVELVRRVFGTLAMTLTMNDVLAKCVLLGLFCVFMTSFAVQIHKLTRPDLSREVSAGSFMVSVVCSALLIFTCFCLYKEDEGLTRLKVHAVGAEREMFDAEGSLTSGKPYPAVDERWISYFRCERILKTYVSAAPDFKRRFDLQINGKLVGGEEREVRCQMWDFSRVTLTAARPQ